MTGQMNESGFSRLKEYYDYLVQIKALSI